MEDNEVYSKIIHSYDDFTHLRLTINIFRGVEYLHLRKYYMDFDEEWKPTKEGVAIPLTINNSQELFTGLIEILSLAESKEIIIDSFKELIEDIYQ